MPLDHLRTLAIRLRNLLRPDLDDLEIREELAHHVELSTRERIAAGEDPREARRAALLELGGVEAFRVEARQSRFGHPLEVALRDLRLGLRRLRRVPAFCLVTVLTLGLGIGLTSSIWSLGRALLAPSLPYPSPERMVVLETAWKGQAQGSTSPAEMRDYDGRLGHVLSAVGGSASGPLTLRTESGPVRVAAAWVTGGTFAALGSPPALGRGFTEDEVREGANVGVLTDRAWRGRFSEDPAILGRQVEIAGGTLEIVGVLPPEVDLPGAVLRNEPHEVFLPFGLDPAEIPDRGSHFIEVIGHLAPGVDLATARSEVEALGRDFVRAFPNDYPEEMGFRISLASLSAVVRGPIEKPLLVLAVIVSFLLVVATTNVATLFLTRIDQRSQELALSAALGAGRGRLLIQVAVEHALLILGGGLVGLGISYSALQGLEAVLPSSVAHLVDPEVDATLLGATVVTTLGLLGILASSPLLVLRGRDLASSLRDATRSATASRRNLRTRRALIAAQIALSMMLLTAAGLLSGSFLRLAGTDPGYRTADLLATRLDIPPATPAPDAETNPDPLRLVHGVRGLLAEVRATPGIENVTAARFLVLEDRPGDLGFEIEGRPVPENRDKPDADWQVVAPSYFETLRIPLERGRALDERDHEDAEGAVVVDRTFVDRFFPGEEALGQRIRLGGNKTSPRWARIVGVAGSVRHHRLDEPDRPRMYLTHAQFRGWSSGRPIDGLHLIVASHLPREAIDTIVREAMSRVLPGTPHQPTLVLDDLRAGTLRIPRLLALLPVVCGSAALFLSMVGLFGIMAQSVRSRDVEMGIRRAFGARGRNLAGLVFNEGARIALFGGLGGGLGSAILARVLESHLYATSAFDPRALAAAWTPLLLAVLMACLGPALRAMRTDPAGLLRAD